MGEVARLIAGLAKEGELESEGQFSLDREKARDKMRQFQLADPRRYVLLLAQAAVLKGAQALEFRIDADDMELRFDGGAFTESDFDQLYTSLFQRDQDRDLLARRELALGLNAAMALNPRFVLVRSGGNRLELRPGQDDDFGPDPQSGSSTLIHVKDRFRPGLVMQFVKSVRDELPESVLLRRHLARCPIPVRLNGAPISGQPWLTGSLVKPRQLRREHTVAAVGYLFDEARGGPAPSRITWLTHGVELATHEVSAMRPGLVAVVNSDELRKDVSQSDLNRNADYEAVVGDLLRLGDEVLADLARSVVARGAPLHDPIVAELRGVLAERTPKGAVLADYERDPLLDALASVPMWMDLGGGVLSSYALLRQDKAFGYSRQTFDGFYPVEQVGPVIYAPNTHIVNQFRDALGGKVPDRASTVRRRLVAEQNRRRWRSQPHPPQLEDGSYSVRVALEQGDIVGELGLRRGGSDVGQLRVVVDGCLLCTLELGSLVPGLTAVIEGPFAPSPSFERASPDAKLAAGVVLVLRGLRQAIVELAETWARQDDLPSGARALLRGFFRRSRAPDYLERTLVALGWSKGGAKRHAALGEGAELSVPISFAAGAAVSPIARLPLFPGLQRRAYSLAELEVARAAGQPLAYVTRRLGALDEDHPVLLASEHELELLEVLSPELRAAAVNFDERYEQLRLRHEFEAKPLQLVGPEAVQLRVGGPVDPRAQIRFERGGSRAMEGVAWLRTSGQEPAVACFAADPEGKRTEEGRPYGRYLNDLRNLELEYDRLAVALTGPVVEPDAHFVGVSNRARERIEAQLGGVELQLAVHCGGEPNARVGRGYALGNFLRERARRLLPDQRLLGVWNALRAGLDSAEAIENYAGVIASHAKSSRRAEEAIDALGSGTLPTLQQLVAAGARRAHGNRVSYYRGLVEQLGPLCELPLFEEASETRSLGWILAQADAAPVRWVPATKRALVQPPPPAPVLVLDGWEASWLFDLLGPQLENAEQWLEDLAADRALTGHPELGSIEIRVPTLVRVPPGKRAKMRGSIGIPDRAPGLVDHASVFLGLRGKRIGTVSVDAELPLVATLDVEEGNYRELERTVLRDVQRELDRRVGQLMRALVEESAKLDELQRRRASAWFMAFFALRAAGSNGDPSRMKDKLLRRLAKAEMLATADGRFVSLADLAHGHRGRDQGVTAYSGRLRPAGSLRYPVFLAEHRGDVENLAKVFGRVVNHDDEERDEAQRRARLDAAPELAAEAPDDALASQAVSGRVRGRLWLTPLVDGVEPEIQLGNEGKRLGAYVSPFPWRAGGALWGSGVRTDQGLSTASLGEKGAALVRTLIVGLYAELARQMGIERDPERQEELRDLLRPVLLHLAHLEVMRGRREDELPVEEQQLLFVLRGLPLLGLPDGHHISLLVARRERPAALSHLGLWEPEPEPEPAVAPASEAEAELAPEAEREVEPANEEVGEAVPPAADGVSDPVLEVVQPRASHPEQLLELVRDELRMVRTHNQELLSDGHLALVRIRAGDGRFPVYVDDGRRKVVALDLEHPLVQRGWRLVDDGEPEDLRAMVSFLASSVYTALNVLFHEITDVHEDLFHALHARHVLSAMGPESDED